MITLRQFSNKPESIPAITSWYLADLGEAKGRQELFTRQAPQRLKVLREHALIESAVSSNRIEGVRVDHERVGELRSPKGAKTEMITAAVERTFGPFRILDIHRECPGVSLDMIRQVLKTMKVSGQVECLGRGQNAQWQKMGKGIR